GQYVDGEPDGLYHIFYDGIGRKQTELSFLAGKEHGPSRTWGPDGKLLFEGMWQDGEKVDGWFEQESTSGSGIYHRRHETWKIVQWNDEKKVPGSLREVKAAWRDWQPGRLPDHGLYGRWRSSRFDKPQDYPYLGTL